MFRFKKGVLNGLEAMSVFDYAKEQKFALPAVNIFSFHSINAALEAASEIQAPIIIQMSHHGSQFLAGKSLSNENQKAAVLGAIVGAEYVHHLAKAYEVTVILHTDHCTKNQLPWLEGLVMYGEEFYKKHQYPLFSSHMLDYSSESLEENIQVCQEYLGKLKTLNMMLEMELGVTGGSEGEMDNTRVAQSRLYTQASEVSLTFQKLREISPNFSIAASFGNVHGVYKPGNVKLNPKILKDSQEQIQAEFNTQANPVNFVFHGGSGSSLEEIREAIDYGVVKMNIDTDLQWAFWEGVKNYTQHKNDYLQSQIGNPEGESLANKKYYSPMTWLREGEKDYQRRLIQAYKDLNVIV